MLAVAPYNTQPAPVNEIKVLEGRRALNEDTVKELERSIRELGLRTPITFRIVDTVDADGDADRDYVLITGLHRLEAFKRMGEEYIPAIRFEGSESDAERWEISENLHRAELTVMERSEHVTRWIEITQEKIEQEKKAAELQSAHVGPIESKRSDGRGHRKESGVNAAVRELGIKRTSTQRAKSVASLSSQAKGAAKKSGLDNDQAALLAASKEKTPEMQVAKVREIAERKKRGSQQKRLSERRQEHEREVERERRAGELSVTIATLLSSSMAPESLRMLRDILEDEHVADIHEVHYHNGIRSVPILKAIDLALVPSLNSGQFDRSRSTEFWNHLFSRTGIDGADSAAKTVPGLLDRMNQAYADGHAEAVLDIISRRSMPDDGSEAASLWKHFREELLAHPEADSLLTSDEWIEAARESGSKLGNVLALSLHRDCLRKAIDDKAASPLAA